MVQRFIAWCGLCVLFVLTAIGCGSREHSKSESVTATERAALTVLAQHDWEDGTLKGWVPRGGTVVLANTTEEAADGTRSLKTTGRNGGFNGPSLNVFATLVKGATYEFTVKARLVTGEAPTTLKTTMQLTASNGTQSFAQVAPSANATDAAFITLTGSFAYNATADITGLLFYVESASATASFYIDSFGITETAPPPAVNILHDFENGTNQGWIPRGPVTLTNTTEAAFDGIRSLKTTGRTSGFNGPSLNLLGTLRKGATYQVSVRAKLVTGEAATTLRVTVQRRPVGATQDSFDNVANASNVTDQAFVAMTGVYSFATDVTSLLLYVEAVSPTASYYIDAFTLVEIAPPPGPPGNTTGHQAAFESGTTEGWASRTGTEVVAVSTADAHTGTQSLLTTNRTSTFRGPALNVTNIMFNGSRYRVELWAKLAPGEPNGVLKVSLQRNLGSNPATFHTVIGDTPVTANAWVRLATTYDVALANTGLQLYVESTGTTPSFYIDDVNVSFVPPPEAERDIPSVYQTLANFFPVGAAIHAGDLTGEHAFLLTKHFSSVTSENDMKWSSLQNVEGVFTYATADAEVAFAKANHLRMRGHTLVWHQQTPAWVFNDANGVPLTPTPENKALLLARMEAHIRAVVGHFGSDLYAWDVVNEVIDPSQPDGFRRSPWFNVTGTEYIDRAFQVAREVAPNAELYINDFDTTSTAKRQFLHDLVADLKSRGIPVDGVGHQMHNNVDFPSGQAIIDTIELFHALGVKNEVTELDVSIYSNSLPGPIADYFDIPAERLVQQGYRYRTFFDAFKRLQGKIASVTFWGQADDHTWLASSGRTNAPLLFDLSLKKKHAYWGVVDPLQLPGADVAVTLDANASVAAGQTLDYALVVRNDGDEDTQPFQPPNDDLPAANVSLSSALPPGTVFESLDAPPGWSCTTPLVGGTGQIACTLESLEVNASESFVLAVRPLCSTPDGSELSATASASSSTLDPNLAPNNSATETSLVSNPPPVVTLAGSTAVTLECGSSFVDPGATALDACDGPVAVTTTGAVNTAVVGVYPLVYDAVDSAGGSALDVTRLVSIIDTIAPVMDANDLTVLLPGVRIVINNGVLRVNGQTFPLDGRTFTILGQTIGFDGESIIVNGVPIVLDGRTVVLLPALGQYQTFTVADFIAALAPDCDANLDLGDIVIDQVTSDELDDKQGGSDGNTTNDMSLAADCRSVRLRIERDNAGNGRVYTVTLRVADASGNRTTRSLKVFVPKNAANGSGVDDGPRNTVTGSCP